VNNGSIELLYYSIAFLLRSQQKRQFSIVCESRSQVIVGGYELHRVLHEEHLTVHLSQLNRCIQRD